MPQRQARFERDAEATKHAILSAAELIFARDGFEGARLEDIAEEAGCNKALIFRYFTDKLGLYRTLITSIKASEDSPIDRLINYALDEESARDPQAVSSYIAASVRELFDFYRQHPCLVRMMMWEAASGWRMFTQTQMSEKFCKRITTIQMYLSVARDAGIVRPEIDATLLLAMIMGLMSVYIPSIPRFEHIFPGVDFRSDEALDRAREQIVQLVLNGTMTSGQEN